MAAQTSSVSYRGTLTPEILLAVLVIGEVPTAFGAHLYVVVQPAEEASQQSGMSISEIWTNVRRLAGRRLLQALATPIDIETATSSNNVTVSR